MEVKNLQWFIGLHPILQGLIATLFTYGVTALGASLVFFFKEFNLTALAVMMGFSAGVMIAASFWSLLSPAIELLALSGKNTYITVAISFMAGGLFVNGSDIFLSAVGVGKKTGKPSLKRSILLTSAVTMHNIPEGLSIGVAFGSLALGLEQANLISACMLALGIGIQNFPEGLCVALPLRKEGFSRGKAFLIGQASGIVEPIAGVLGVVAAMSMRSFLPIALSFSAGAMIAVVCSELIPEAFRDSKIIPSIGLLSGFCVMMVLDIALG
jgi:ZIP family zinc transporter